MRLLKISIGYIMYILKFLSDSADNKLVKIKEHLPEIELKEEYLRWTTHKI